jgi:hypothetical protein
MKITTICIDLAKSVFQVHGVDSAAKTVLKRQIRREAMPVYIAETAPVCQTGEPHPEKRNECLNTLKGAQAPAAPVPGCGRRKAG